MDRRTVASGYEYEAVHGYCRAVRVGAHIFVSGTTARGAALAGDAYEQACSAFAVIEAALRELGSGMGDVVRTVIFLVDMADAAAVSRAHREVLGSVQPASTMVQVAGLLAPSMRVEVEVTAMVAP